MNGGSAIASTAAAPLARRALSLGAANAFDYALQFLLPVVLVRCLAPDDFGQYRLLWLAAGTAMAVVTQAMAGSLFYFLPRSDAAAKRLYINQTLVFLAAAGLIAAWAVSAWNPWLPGKMREIARHDALLPAFILLWVLASPLDLLATAEERVAWQARATIGLSALRTVAVAAAALLTRQLEPVLLVLLGFAAFKLAVLLGYVARHHGLRGPVLRPRVFADQVLYAAPFGAAGALYGLRAQADQWVAAALFSVGMFAAFSIGMLLGPLMQLLRTPVMLTFLPSMSRLQSAGDLRGMIELNRRANVLVATFAFPLLAFAFAFAEDIVTVIYTATYLDAAPVMRVCIVGLAALVLELATTMQLLRQGAFVLRLGLVLLPLSVACSWCGAQFFGLAGAAAGTVAAIYADLAATLLRIAKVTGLVVRRQQDWRVLGLLMLFAALAAVLAWSLSGRYLAGEAPLLRAVAGGLLVAAAYAALVAASARGRGWIAALCRA
jgi:O-antigen/teichoic acid export membrane protein